MAHSAPVKSVLQLPVVLGRSEVGDSFTKIPEKVVASFGALYHSPSQDWQPWGRIVTAKLLELCQHVVSPVLRAGFPTVIDHVLDAFLTHLVSADGLLVTVEIFLEIIFHEAAVEFVHFKPCRLRRRWMIRDSQQ